MSSEINSELLLSRVSSSSSLSSDIDIAHYNNTLSDFRTSKEICDTNNVRQNPDDSTNQKNVSDESRKEEQAFAQTISFLSSEYSIYSSYYDGLHEYHGVIDSIDYSKQTFTAVLNEKGNKLDQIVVDFQFDSLPEENYGKKLCVGLQIIWLFGKEIDVLEKNGMIKKGTMRNISKIIFRSMGCIGKRKQEIANEYATKLAGFLDQIT